jgi:SAM-dependent methyltransferase
MADPQVIADYEASMLRDLVKSGIAVERLADWNVMDVGTGRQALAFLSMEAKHVVHHDISSENVARVEKHIAEAALSRRLETRCCDIVETDLGRDRFDLVYLNGIVQHFSDVGKGISNCVRALKTDGYLWLYFYRSGTFDNFILYMLRTLAAGSNVVTDPALMRDYYAASRLFFSPEARDNYLTSIFMDGIFTRQARLYSVSTYLDFADAAGFEVVSSSGLDPLGRDVDHYFARAAGVVTLRKVRAVEENRLREAASILAPEREVDQLAATLYDPQRDREILQSLALYRQLEQWLAAPGVPPTAKILSVMRIFAFLAVKTREAGYDPMRRHADFQALLSAMIDLLSAEYA